ncbi:carboxymuconolactone decarboxylase family protein [Jatrophihabitans lederbergiae]|uniref:Carboxymuconolactone decarboxylase family protein n=1 Tax=Jatrophihabitans lederbergiae TaxID=3075547 RepID=A0ABU2JGP3_9ACTN|nr:carboxymuconolactone decarboxylase family protein [Jatrophihabitans sp. DSM 44399]MDT0264161.1 carboxymuconolactone decarboxylase family protein [Jatrophihabitans sp. DSM 44399]
MSDIPDARESRSRRAGGISAYAKIFGVPEQEVPAVFAARVGSTFAEEALHAAGGPAWSHPALTGRDRSIAIITALAGQGVSGDRLSTHLRLGRQHGLDEDALSALMTLLAGYIGYPRASLAMETIHRSFASGGQRDTAPVGRPLFAGSATPSWRGQTRMTVGSPTLSIASPSPAGS